MRNIKNSDCLQTTKLDYNSFEKLFKELYPQLCRFCIRFVRTPQIAEEIVQEQFVQIWEKRESVEYSHII